MKLSQLESDKLDEKELEDILMGKHIWEIVDLDERVNFPFYFPIEGDLGPDRKPLYEVLINGIKDGSITEVYDSGYFTDKKSLKDIEESLVFIDTTDAGREYYNAGESIPEEYITKTEIEAYHVDAYKIKGYWYFDKRQGELKYRLLALAPIAPDVQVMGREDLDITEQLPLFWVWFPDARNVLHSMKVFNQKNSAYPISFDHLLNARRFNSIIYKEENIYGDREISNYVKGNALFQVIESNKMKDEIRNKELDMWNY